MRKSYIDVRHPVMEDDHHGNSKHYPQRHHSSYYQVAKYSVADGVLTIEHNNGTKSFVVLGKGYTVMELLIDS